jgi:hypothetical protein
VVLSSGARAVPTPGPGRDRTPQAIQRRPGGGCILAGPLTVACPGPGGQTQAAAECAAVWAGPSSAPSDSDCASSRSDSDVVHRDPAAAAAVPTRTRSLRAPEPTAVGGRPPALRIDSPLARDHRLRVGSPDLQVATVTGPLAHRRGASDWSRPARLSLPGFAAAARGHNHPRQPSESIIRVRANQPGLPLDRGSNLPGRPSR